MCSVRDAMIELGVACDGGKDSLSMAANAGDEVVMAPGNLVVSAYVTCPDITTTVTPDLKLLGSGVLLHVDMSLGQRRLGGSCLGQVFNQVGMTCWRNFLWLYGLQPHGCKHHCIVPWQSIQGQWRSQSKHILITQRFCKSGPSWNLGLGYGAWLSDAYLYGIVKCQKVVFKAYRKQGLNRGWRAGKHVPLFLQKQERSPGLYLTWNPYKYCLLSMVNGIPDLRILISKVQQIRSNCSFSRLFAHYVTWSMVMWFIEMRSVCSVPCFNQAQGVLMTPDPYFSISSIPN